MFRPCLRQCDIALQNLGMLVDLFGDLVQVALIPGTDFGTRHGLFLSRAVNHLIHRRTGWKTFIHSCGSGYRLRPDSTSSSRCRARPPKWMRRGRRGVDASGRATAVR